MATLSKNWSNGGTVDITYTGDGDGSAIFSSTPNTGGERTMTVRFVDGGRSIVVERLIKQAGQAVSQETYTRLTYIESTGEQYINLNYIVQEDDIIEMQYVTTEQSSTDKMLLGCTDSIGAIWYEIYSNTAYVRYGSDESKSVGNARQKNRVKIQRGEVNIDGTTAVLAEDGMPQIPLYLFARNEKNERAVMYGKYKSTGLIIHKASGQIVMDLKPAKRDSDAKIGMLDLISGTFYENQGDGADFIGAGEARITEEYELIEYIAFNNDKIFDTGHYGDEKTYIEVLFQRTDTSGADYLFGCSSGNRLTGYLTTSGYWRYGSGYPTFNTNNKLLNYAYVTPGKTTVSGSTKTFSIGNAFTTAFTIPLGGHRPSSGVATPTYQGYVYYFRIWSGDVLVADYVPCKRLSDGVEGFWDCVTQTFIEPI